MKSQKRIAKIELLGGRLPASEVQLDAPLGERVVSLANLLVIGAQLIRAHRG
jgi:hypothetical protein